MWKCCKTRPVEVLQFTTTSQVTVEVLQNQTGNGTEFLPKQQLAQGTIVSSVSVAFR